MGWSARKLKEPNYRLHIKYALKHLILKQKFGPKGGKVVKEPEVKPQLKI